MWLHILFNDHVFDTLEQILQKDKGIVTSSRLDQEERLKQWYWSMKIQKNFFMVISFQIVTLIAQMVMQNIKFVSAFLSTMQCSDMEPIKMH